MPKPPTHGDAEDRSDVAVTLPERIPVPATMAGALMAPTPRTIAPEATSDLMAGVAPITGETRSVLIAALTNLTQFQLRIVSALAAGINEQYPDKFPEWDEARRREIVEAMLAAIPDADLYDRQIGLFYTTTGVGRMKHLSNPTVLRYARAGRLLAIESANGYVFPEFQFSARGDVPDLLPTVIGILRSATFDSWRIALWMTKSPSGTPSPIDLLNSGQGPAAVRRARALVKRNHAKGAK